MTTENPAGRRGFFVEWRFAMTTATPWYETESLWDAWAPLGFDAERVLAATGEVDQIAARLELPAGAAVLDLCCGVGRHSIELARRGYRVTGVDRSEQFLKSARERAASEGLDVEFVQSDMRQFSRTGGFDAALSYFTSFGYFEDDAEHRQVLDNVCRSLRPGGRVLLELMGKESIARMFRPRDWQERAGILLLEERKPIDHWRFIHSRWTFLKDGRREDFELKIRCFSAVEIEELLTAAGFARIDIFGDVAGAPYDHEARRLVVVARKPDNG
jgi:SAM-dependent methyltransferase